MAWARGTPVSAADVTVWVRTKIRAPGSSWRSDDPVPETRRLGPWHAMTPDDGWQAWCSVRPRRVHHEVRTAAGPVPVPEVGNGQPHGKVCPACLAAMASGRPAPYRRR